MERGKQTIRTIYKSDSTSRNEQIRTFCDISGQKPFKSLQVSQEISISIEKQGNKISESGMVNRYHVYKAASRKRVPDAIIDRFSRKVLNWRLFNTMDALQYANLLKETIEECGCPAIFNTDQGSQFTSDCFINVLEENNIEISMDGKDRALDNVRIERLWRSLKY